MADKLDRDKLVIVNKTRLRVVRDNHREIVEAARKSDSLASAWVLLGVQAAAIDELLTEIVDS